MELEPLKNGGIDFVREQPDRFLRGRCGVDVELASSLVSDAVIAGSRTVIAKMVDGYWYIISEEDWLEKFVGSGRDVFTDLVAFPEAGDNSILSTVVVNAFSRDLCTFSANEGHTWIKGERNMAIERSLGELVDFSVGRAITFAV